MPTPRIHVPGRWRTVLALALAVGLLWFFFRSVNFAELWAAGRQAHVSLLLAAVAITFGTYVLRTWRWQALLRPIGVVPFGLAFRATVIGFTATFLLPARIGEVLRPYLVARRRGFSFTSAFATIIVERVLDLAAVLFLFGWFVLSVDVRTLGPAFKFVQVSGALAAGVAVGALALMFLGAGHPERLGHFATRLSRALPERAAHAIGKLVRTFAEGLAVMRRPGPLVVAAVLSVPMWLSIALGIWYASRAFDLTIPLPGTFLVIMFLVVGVAVPTPGGVGTFEWAYRYAMMTFFGAAKTASTAAALVLHAVSFAPISLLGLVFMGQDGLTLAGLQRLRDEAEKDA